MPKLRPGEKMQRCLCEFHDSIRRQKYYIKRTYYNDLEQKFCPGCLSHLMHTRMLLKYTVGEGYEPIGETTMQQIINIYGVEVKSGR